MLKDSQKDILDNWEDATPSEKDRIKNHLSENLAEIELLRKIGPNDAYDVVQDAVDKYQQRNPHRNPTEQTARNNYAKWTFALLYNGLSEKAINYGVNVGVSYTLLWRINHGVTSANIMLRRTSSTREKVQEHEKSHRKKLPNNPAAPPQDDETRLKRIFQLEGSDRLLDNFEFLLRCGEDAIEYNNSCEDYIIVDEQGNYPEDSQELLQEAAEAIEKTKKTAEMCAIKLNNPRINIIDAFPTKNVSLLDWHMREYIELHRDHLKSKGILPDDDAIPDYDSVPYRDPTELDFTSWYRE
jgi:hypothetical protein